MVELTPLMWSVLALGALVVGLSKTALPGGGTLAVALFAAVLPARTSTATLLVLLIVGDALALLMYRRHEHEVDEKRVRIEQPEADREGELGDVDDREEPGRRPEEGLDLEARGEEVHRHDGSAGVGDHRGEAAERAVADRRGAAALAEGG
jgi:membrane protein implicated in regulation of membrane protease activity